MQSHSFSAVLEDFFFKRRFVGFSLSPSTSLFKRNFMKATEDFFQRMDDDQQEMEGEKIGTP